MSFFLISAKSQVPDFRYRKHSRDCSSWGGWSRQYCARITSDYWISIILCIQQQRWTILGLIVRFWMAACILGALCVCLGFHCAALLSCLRVATKHIYTHAHTLGCHYVAITLSLESDMKHSNVFTSLVHRVALIMYRLFQWDCWIIYSVACGATVSSQMDLLLLTSPRLFALLAWDRTDLWTLSVYILCSVYYYVDGLIKLLEYLIFSHPLL